MKGCESKNPAQDELVGEADLADRNLPYRSLHGINFYGMIRRCCVMVQESIKARVSISYIF